MKVLGSSCSAERTWFVESEKKKRKKMEKTSGGGTELRISPILETVMSE